MKSKRSPVQSSRMDALKLEEVQFITDYLPGKGDLEKSFLFNCLMFGGYRINELLHQQKDWLHINDEYSKSMGLDYIQVPQKGEFCQCRDCKIQAYLESESNKDGVVYTAAWQKEVLKSFDVDNVNGRYWQPKTADGARKIPILYDSFRNELINFYITNKRLDYSRQWAWKQIKEISMDIWGFDELPSKNEKGVYRIPKRDLYPHAMRATAASLWAMRGINATALKEIMGWSSIEIADIYVMSDEKQALLTCKNLVNGGKQ